MPDTPRAIRIPDALWWSALEKARANGDTVSDIVRVALEKYAVCDECHGKGWVWDAPPNGGKRRVRDACGVCSGDGLYTPGE
jgi:DnaJ-class molecular chaperone